MQVYECDAERCQALAQDLTDFLEWQPGVKTLGELHEKINGSIRQILAVSGSEDDDPDIAEVLEDLNDAQCIVMEIMEALSANTTTEHALTQLRQPEIV